MPGLYSVSPALFRKVTRIGKRIQAAVQGRGALLEYITLPEAGQHVVLRFELWGEISSLDEIDAMETRLSRLAGEAFWAVLVGDAYRQAKPSLPLAALPMRLAAFAQGVRHQPLPVASTPFAPEIARDAQIIRAHIPLSPGDWVWEVEIPLPADASVPIIRIAAENPREGQVVTIGEQEFAVEYVPHDAGYKGLVKAYPLARAAGMAVVHYILEANRTG